MPSVTLGASAATQPAEGLPAIAEQLELLFEAPPAALGRPATIPSRTPNRSGSGPASAKSTHRRKKTGSERPSDGFAEPNRYLAFPDDGGRTNGAGTPNGAAIPAKCPVVPRDRGDRNAGACCCWIRRLLLWRVVRLRRHGSRTRGIGRHFLAAPEKEQRTDDQSTENDPEYPLRHHVLCLQHPAAKGAGSCLQRTECRSHFESGCP